MLRKAIQLGSAFIAFTLGLLWILPFAHEFREIPSTQHALNTTTLSPTPFNLNPPMGWAGVWFYCASVLFALVLVVAGAYIGARGAHSASIFALSIGTVALTAAVGFYAFAPNGFWSAQVLPSIDDQMYMILSILAACFAVAALGAGLAGYQLPAPALTRPQPGRIHPSASGGGPKVSPLPGEG